MNEEPNSPSSVVHILPSTSTQIDVFAGSIINEVKDGNESPLKVLVQLRAMEKASKAILDGIKENILTAAEKYPGKDFELWGNKLSKEDVKTEYDYTVCCDPTFERLEVDFNKAKADLEERKTFLRTIKVPTPVGDTVTGELVTVHPPKKLSTPGVKVFIK